MDQLPPPRPLAPLPPRNGREPGQTSSTTPDSDSDGSVRPHPGASSFRPSPTVVQGPRELLQEFTIALRNAHLEPFTAWTQGELDEMVRRKKDKDSRPTYKTIARFLQKPTEEVKQAWKVHQQLEARAEGTVHRKNERLPEGGSAFRERCKLSRWFELQTW